MKNKAQKNEDMPFFSDMLSQNIVELPENIVKKVTPWKQAMNKILVGMGLCTVTLNFWYLNYIFPPIGIILMLLGFRTLRRENKWFASCFAVTAVRTAILFTQLILNAFIVYTEAEKPFFANAATALNIILPPITILLLRSAIRSVQEKSGIRKNANSAVALLIWYTAVTVLALLNFSGIVIPIALIAVFILTIRGLYKLSSSLDEAGYCVKATPVKISDRALSSILAVCLLTGCICGYTFGGSYKMNKMPRPENEHNEVTEIKDGLIKLGFPEYVLNDLTSDDIRACKDAEKIMVKVTDNPVNNGKECKTEHVNTDGSYSYSYRTEYEVKELRITGIGVRLPGEQENWRLFHHFLWLTDPGFYGTEALQIWPTKNCWHTVGDFSGRILYEENGETYISEYHSIEQQSYSMSDPLFGTQINSDVFATFSLPRNGENQRGYITYEVNGTQSEAMIDSWINYTHQLSPLQYPVMTAKNKRMTNSWNSAWPFITVQDALQFNPEE